MAIATIQGHTQRAIDFFNKAGKFFIIGGTEPWSDEASPDSPSTSDYKLKDTVAYKRVDNCYLVVPDDVNGTISYRTQKWRIVSAPFSTTVGTGGVDAGSAVVPLTSITGMTVGSKVRVASTYEGTIVSIDNSNNRITLDIVAPSTISAGSSVEAGALVEGAKYVYVDCYLDYDRFPIVTYRQIGLCSEVAPNMDVLRAAAYSTSGNNEFTNAGVLEVIDNRAPNTRDIDQRELISLILEY